MSVYINGVLDNTATTTLSYMPSGSAIIGNSHWEFNAPFNGAIDEIHLYNRALSTREIGYLAHFLESSVAAGPGIKLTIKNVGPNDAKNIDWSIQIKGGILGLINKAKSGSIDTLVADASTTVSSGRFLGLGVIKVTITLDMDTKVVNATQLVIYTKLI